MHSTSALTLTLTPTLTPTLTLTLTPTLALPLALPLTRYMAPEVVQRTDYDVKIRYAAP